MPPLDAFRGKLPLLGVCYGAQYLARLAGGTVQSAPAREYGRAMLEVADAEDPLMRALPPLAGYGCRTATPSPTRLNRSASSAARSTCVARPSA